MIVLYHGGDVQLFLTLAVRIIKAIMFYSRTVLLTLCLLLPVTRVVDGDDGPVKRHCIPDVC